MKPASSTAALLPATLAALPRILLVEDDPTSRTFLAAAAAATPADVDSADCMAAALVLAGSQHYDLWLFDAQLPDGSGIELLHRLRASALTTALPSPMPATMPPALAHTACTEPATHTRLRAAGFAEVLVKPLSATALQTCLRGALGLVPDAPDTAAESAADASSTVAAASVPVWDDASAALALNGNHAHIQTLRGLFLQELPQVHARIVAAVNSGDVDTARHDLHKLRASCGFVGASRLAVTVRALQQRTENAELLAEFEAAAHTTAGSTGTDGSGGHQVPASS